MTIDPSFAQKLSGLGQVLQNHLEAEQGPIEGNDMSVDTFVNSFEDEFPRDPDDPALGSYPTYSDEALRAAREQPYGLARGDRPKVWELNQPPPSRVSGWRVLDLYPNRETKNEFYRLAGTPAELRIMLQLIRHTQEIVKRFAAGGIVFEDWFKEWADGWDSFTSRTNAELNLSTNYPAVETAKTDPNSGQVTTIPRWRQPATKPAYIEWKNATGGIPDGYRVIEYFPDRSQPFESVLFTGTDTEIANHIIRYHSSAQGGGTLDGDTGMLGESPLSGGHPMVTLYFAAAERLPNHTDPTRTRMSFRLMNKVESAEYAHSGESVLTKADVDQLKAKIKTQYVQTRYKIERGDIIFSYTDRPAGFALWNPLRTRAEAIRVYTDLLSLADKQFNESKLKEATTAARASTVPDKVLTVLGEQKTVRIGYKKEDLFFTHAILHLPIIRKRMTLAISRVAEVIR